MVRIRSASRVCCRAANATNRTVECLTCRWEELMSLDEKMYVAQSDRRWFLVKASAAAMAGLAIGGEIILDAQTPSEPAPGIQNFTAAQLHDDIAALASTPGDNKLVNLPTFTVALTVEKNKAAQE